MVATATVATAQVQKSTQEQALSQMALHTPQLNMVAPEATCTDDITFKASGPKKSVADKVFFTRPWGTYYRSNLSWTDWTGTVLKVPGATDIVLTNRSADKSASTWVASKLSTNAYSNVDENGNAVVRLARSNGYVYYLPAMMAGDTMSFSLGLDVDRMYYEPTDSLSLMTLQDTRYVYTGFSNTGYFGLKGKDDPWNLTVNGVTRPATVARLVQPYPQPLRPYCLYNLQFNAEGMPCTAEEMTPIFKGDAHLDIYFIGTQDKDTLGHMTAGAADTIGYTYNVSVERATSTVVAAQYEEDAFGNLVVKPIILDKPFTLVIDGFDREGVECGIYMTAQTNVRWERHDVVADAIRPTVVQPKFIDTEGGYRYPLDNISSGYWQYSATGNSYSMVTYLNGFWDVVDVIAGDQLTAPVAGGRCTFVSDGSTFVGPQYQSTRPYIEEGSRVPNYQVEGLPSWLSITQNIDANYNADAGWVNILDLNAEALPNGVSGRVAQFTITSEFGAKSNVVTVVQGDATGITTIDNKTGNTGNGAIYNLAGQRVNDSYNGVVIENGKKVIKK